jgi:hypothetical protein
MVDTNKPDETRRTFLKGAVATGMAATGLTAFSGSAAAQDSPITVDGLGAQSGNIGIQRGNRNAVIHDLNVAFTSVNFDQDLSQIAPDDTVTGTGSGTVTGSVLPNPNANQRAARTIDTTFEDVEFEAIVEEVDGGEEVNGIEVPEGEGISEFIRLELEPLFLDVLGLQVRLSEVLLLVTADPEGGLLGELLAGLGREV